MTNILVGPEAPSGSQYGESDPTAASPACCESATGRAPTWWAARGGEDPRSTTFRALAWSQDDCPADLLPYEGEDYVVPQANTAMPWYRGAARLYVIAAGVAAVAFGGLVLSTSGVDYVVTTTPITVTQPATSAPEPALDGHSANHVGATQSAAPAPPPAPPWGRPPAPRPRSPNHRSPSRRSPQHRSPNHRGMNHLWCHYPWWHPSRSHIQLVRRPSFTSRPSRPDRILWSQGARAF